MPLESERLPSPRTAPGTTSATQSERDRAFPQLEGIAAQDRARPAVRGQWVARLSSKSEDIVDTSLQAAPFTLLWVSVADIDRSAAADVRVWCHAHFAERGSALENAFLPRQLKVRTS